MNHLWLVLPLLIPLLTAAVSILAWRSPRAQRLIAVAGAALLLGAALRLLERTAETGIQVLQVAGWPATYGITLVADLLSAIMVVLTALIGLAGVITSTARSDRDRHSFAYYPLLHVLLLGVSGAFLTGDIFNLYVWFEVMLMASFVLLGMGGERRHQEAAIKYVALNLMSSAIFLAAVGVIYGVAHTLNMADLSVRLRQVGEGHPHLVGAVAGLLVTSFGIKAAVFPLFFWLPASYHTPPAAVAAVFAGLLTKVGVYSLIRVLSLVFPPMPWLWTVILVIAGIGMLVGVVGAVAQFDIRRILGFHSISQIGYMIMGLGLLGAPSEVTRRLALTATILFIVHHSIVKSNLFLVGGAVRALRGTYDLKSLGGLAVAAPWLAVLFLIPALSLAGIPPLSGFWAKLAVVKVGVDARAYLLVAAALAAGLLTLISMMKIWNEGFWKPAPGGGGGHHDQEREAAPVSGKPVEARRHMIPIAIPIAGLALLAVLIGLYPQWLFELADRAAGQLLDPGAYVAALQAGPP